MGLVRIKLVIFLSLIICMFIMSTLCIYSKLNNEYNVKSKEINIDEKLNMVYYSNGKKYDVDKHSYLYNRIIDINEKRINNSDKVSRAKLYIGWNINNSIGNYLEYIENNHRVFFGLSYKDDNNDSTKKNNIISFIDKYNSFFISRISGDEILDLIKEQKNSLIVSNDVDSFFEIEKPISIKYGEKEYSSSDFEYERIFKYYTFIINSNVSKIGENQNISNDFIKYVYKEGNIYIDLNRLGYFFVKGNVSNIYGDIIESGEYKGIIDVKPKFLEEL